MVARAETVTILFTDLVGSTELLQRAGDDDAQRIFKSHHLLLREVMARHGGQEVKWLGDGLMVAFDSAVEAVRAAIEMQQASRRPAAGERLHIRAGLNVGEALRDDLDYFGSAVVIARRLCDSGDAGEIRVSDLVARILDERREFSFEDLGDLTLKGIAKPVHGWRVGYAHDPSAMLSRTPFIGREREFAALESMLAAARSGAGALAMLVGEPGIGKTRAIDEFVSYARGCGAQALLGRCYDGEWVPAFAPFVEALRQYTAAAPIDELRSLPAADIAVLARIVPNARVRLPDLPEPPALPAESERYRLLEAVSNTLGAIAAARPLVLVLDDLHWADKGSIAMLQHLARGLASSPMLVLGAYRDAELNRQHPLARALTDLRRDARVERIVLKGLTRDDVGQLLSVVAEQDVPEQLVDAIASETNGNPFFVKEVLLHLVEEGEVVQADGRWTTDLSIAEMRIPEGVREVIGRRLSRLSEVANRMLTVVSAMTGGCTWTELRAVDDEQEAELLDALDESLGAQVLIERETGTYEFTHALFRHTLYEELSTPRWSLLHRRIGEALEPLHR